MPWGRTGFGELQECKQASVTEEKSGKNKMTENQIKGSNKQIIESEEQFRASYIEL